MSAVFLEFKKDESVISSDRTTLANEQDGVILHTYFVMPVRFGSERVEFFELFNDPWLPLPMLHLAVIGYEEVEKLSNGIRAEYQIPNVGHRLIFERQGNQIQILSTLNNHTDNVDPTELLNTFESFLFRVKNLIITETPEILVHNNWRKWLKIAENNQ